MRHFFFLPSKIKVLNFIKRERLKQVFFVALKELWSFIDIRRSFLSQVSTDSSFKLTKTLKLLRFPRQKHSQLPSTLACLLNLYNQWKKMASR